MSGPDPETGDEMALSSGQGTLDTAGALGAEFRGPGVERRRRGAATTPQCTLTGVLEGACDRFVGTLGRDSEVPRLAVAIVMGGGGRGGQGAMDPASLGR